MKLLQPALCAAMALSFAAILPATATAAPLPASGISTSSEVLTVRHRGYRHRGHRRFERRGGHAWYNGHRGYRERRHGYRYHNGYWFPPAAFIAGAIIGSVIENQAYAGDSSDAHVQWCMNNYRSYRASDDTFQPYEGPRRRCNSPYN